MKIGIIGAEGKMGKSIINIILSKKIPNVELSACGVSDRSKIIGHNVYDNIVYSNDKTNIFKNSDIIIDFSTVESFSESLDFSEKFQKPIVSGISGINDNILQKMYKISEKICICWSMNMSLSIIMMSKIVKELSSKLPNHDCEIIESHHSTKKDSPSGTAIILGNAVADGRDWKFDKVAKFGRNGSSIRREKQEIGFSSIRAGSIAGEHKVMFVDDMFSISIEHKVFDRVIFAQGAIDIAIKLFNLNQKNGFFTIEKLFNL